MAKVCNCYVCCAMRAADRVGGKLGIDFCFDHSEACHAQDGKCAFGGRMTVDDGWKHEGQNG